MDGMQIYFKKALADLEEAKSTDKSLLHALCYQMEILMNFGSPEAVRKLRDQALAINPYSLTARLYYISTLVPRWGGSIEQMASEVALARPYYDKNPRLRILEGRVSAELGDQAYLSQDYALAIQYYSDALKHGNHWYYYKQRGEAYSRLKDYSHANQDLDIAIQLRPNYSQAYFARGSNHYQLGNWDRAIEDFSRMLTADVNDPVAWDRRGDAFFRAGNISSALADFEKAWVLEPTNRRYRSNYEKAKRLVAGNAEESTPR